VKRGRLAQALKLRVVVERQDASFVAVDRRSLEGPLVPKTLRL
jgi:hypothetical protein